MSWRSCSSGSAAPTGGQILSGQPENYCKVDAVSQLRVCSATCLQSSVEQHSSTAAGLSTSCMQRITGVGRPGRPRLPVPRDLGGDWRSSRKHAHAQWLAAAAVAGPSQAAAFARLGDFYGQVAGDAARARKCYQRALALDPLQADAGEM